MTRTLLLLFLLSVLNGQAQLDSAGIELKQTVVSADRMEGDKSRTPRSVSIITGDELRQKGFRTLAEAFSYSSGVYIIGADQNPGTNQSVFMRGASTEHVAVFIDGVRITDPSSVNNAVNLNEINIQNIERIEILRGPAGVAWGTGAVGGVINIITTGNMGIGFKGTIDAMGGYFDEGSFESRTQFNLNYGHKSGFYAVGGAMFQQSTGLDASLDTITDPNAYRTTDRDGFQQIEWNAKLGYNSQDGKWRTSALYRCNTQWMDIDAGAFRDDDNYVVDFHRKLLRLDAIYTPSSRFSITLNGGWSSMIREVENDSSVIDDAGNYDRSFYEAKYTGQVLNADLVAGYRADHLRLSGGLSFYREDMNNSSYFYSSSIWGVYEAETDLDSLELAQDVSSAWVNTLLNAGVFSESLNWLNFEAGARAAVHSQFGFQPVFNAGLSATPDSNTTLFINLQGGFNAPSLYRQYTPESNYISSISRGNSNLKPEESLALELGFRHTQGSFTVEGAVFRNQIQNSVQYVYLWDGNIGLDSLGSDWLRDDYRGDTYLNMGRMITSGFELSAHFRASQKLQILAQISMVNGVLQLDRGEMDQTMESYHIQHFESGVFVSNDLVNIVGLDRRSNTASMRIDYALGKGFSIGAQGRGVSPRYDLYYDGSLGPYGALNRAIVQDYLLIDVFAGWHNEKVNIALNANNVLNKEYAEISGFRTRPFGVYLYAGYSF